MIGDALYWWMLCDFMKTKTFYISEDRLYLAINKSKDWEKLLGALKAIPGDEALGIFSIEQIEECLERGFVKKSLDKQG